MNKRQLIDRVRERTGLPRRDCAAAVEAALAAVVRTVGEGERVLLTGFGAFEVQNRAARSGRNPKTGETVAIPPTRTAAFRPGGALRKAVSRR